MFDTFYDAAHPYFDRWTPEIGKTTHQGRIAIVGLPDSGKKTLMNSFYGWDAVGESSDTARSYGLIEIVDLPMDSYDSTNVMYRLENAAAIIYVLDGRKGLQSDSFNWIARLRSLDATLLVVLSRSDLVAPDKLQKGLALLEQRLARPVLPIAATDKEAVQNQLIEALLKLSPDLSVPLASEIPDLRGKVARQIMMQTVASGLRLSLEMDELNYLHDLKRIEMQMVQQIAAVYGYTGTRNHDGIMLSLLLRWASRNAAPLLNNVNWMKSWMRTGLVSGMLTLVVGHLAILSYGAKLPGWMNRFSPQAWRNGHASVDSH